VITYSQLKPDQNNRASSLTNFFRNWGGSFGIALITTMSERRQDFHQARLGNHLAASSDGLQRAIAQTTAYLEVHGYSHADAVAAATLRFYNQLGAQTHMLAFMDCFWILGVMTLMSVPLVLLTQNFRVGGKAPEAH